MICSFQNEELVMDFSRAGPCNCQSYIVFVRSSVRISAGNVYRDW